MKRKEMQSKSKDDLQKKAHELRKELIKEKAQVAIGSQLKSPRKIHQLRKTVARIETLLQQKDQVENQKKTEQKEKKVSGEGKRV